MEKPVGKWESGVTAVVTTASYVNYFNVCGGLLGGIFNSPRKHCQQIINFCQDDDFYFLFFFCKYLLAAADIFGSVVALLMYLNCECIEEKWKQP